MYKSPCWSNVAAVAICLPLSLGCAPAVRIVEGQVTLDGKALATARNSAHLELSLWIPLSRITVSAL